MGMIQCGSFTGNTTTTLGWEPQFVMLKRTDAAGDWMMIDSMRGCSVGGVDMILSPNLSSTEVTTNDYIDFTATGFISKNLTGTYVYMTVRRPNKPPTTGTQVYNAIARTGTSAAVTVTGVGFAPDLALTKSRNTMGQCVAYDRLRGYVYLMTQDTAAESAGGTVLASDVFAYADGVAIGVAGLTNASGDTYINHFFKRAPGVFDVVCYTGTGSVATVAHSLGVAPELMIVKRRNNVGDWLVYSSGQGSTKEAYVNSTASFGNAGTTWNITEPTSSVFSLGTSVGANSLGSTYIAYLFATKAGISKVGSYTGNGSSINLDMGFSTGCRFFMCKRTDSTGDWFVYDTARGVVAGNDPHLSLNTTAAEVTTDDSVDPYTQGLTVNQVSATNINVTSATYVYLAFA